VTRPPYTPANDPVQAIFYLAFGRKAALVRPFSSPPRPRRASPAFAPLIRPPFQRGKRGRGETQMSNGPSSKQAAGRPGNFKDHWASCPFVKGPPIYGSNTLQGVPGPLHGNFAPGPDAGLPGESCPKARKSSPMLKDQGRS